MQIGCYNQNLAIKSKTFNVVFEENSLQINDFKITDPGEYEVGGVSVKFEHGRFLFHIENMPLAYLPSLTNGGAISTDELDELSQAEILLLRVNEFDEKSQKELADIISKIDPKCFVAIFDTTESASTFAKEYNTEPVSEVKITSVDLPEEGRNTILMVCPKKISTT